MRGEDGDIRRSVVTLFDFNGKTDFRISSLLFVFPSLLLLDSEFFPVLKFFLLAPNRIHLLCQECSPMCSTDFPSGSFVSSVRRMGAGLFPQIASSLVSSFMSRRCRC
jgi:hypothetical protein